MQRIIVLSSYLKLSIIQLTMRKTGLLLISLLFCASCADKHDHKLIFLCPLRFLLLFCGIRSAAFWSRRGVPQRCDREFPENARGIPGCILPAEPPARFFPLPKVPPRAISSPDGSGDPFYAVPYVLPPNILTKKQFPHRSAVRREFRRPAFRAP